MVLKLFQGLIIRLSSQSRDKDFGKKSNLWKKSKAFFVCVFYLAKNKFICIAKINIWAILTLISLLFFLHLSLPHLPLPLLSPPLLRLRAIWTLSSQQHLFAYYPERSHCKTSAIFRTLQCSDAYVSHWQRLS